MAKKRSQTLNFKNKISSHEDSLMANFSFDLISLEDKEEKVETPQQIIRQKTNEIISFSNIPSKEVNKNNE